VNEDKIKVNEEDPSCIKIGNNNTSSMVQLISKNVIDSGIHELTLTSINDPGGYTVIGITDKESSD